MKEQLRNFFNIRNFFRFSGRVTGFQVVVASAVLFAILAIEFVFVNGLTNLLYNKTFLPFQLFTGSKPPLDWQGIPSSFVMTFAIVMALQSVPMFISGLSFAVRRLHDFNFCGWWLLFFYVLCFALHYMTLDGGVTFLYWLFLVFPGTVGENRYGKEEGR
jgi:uncharacterized membrane protein YhaH (DUF805 family)